MSLSDTTPQKPKKSLFGNLLGGGKGIWVAATGAALIAIFAVLTLLGNATARTTYYVLNQPVAARTQITPEMLQEVPTIQDGAPTVAYGPTQLMEKPLFAKVPLQAGDILSSSTVGELERIDTDLPENFVVTSFQVTPENAVAGKVRKGDYIDLIATQGSNDAGAVAKVVLHRVLVLDVTVAPETIADAANSGQEGADLDPGPESNAVRGGIPSVYTVGLSPEDATKLALVRDSNLLVALSSNSKKSEVNAQTQYGNVFSGEPVADSGAGTEKASEAAKAQDGQAPTQSAPATPAPTETAPTETAPAEPAN